MEENGNVKALSLPVEYFSETIFCVDVQWVQKFVITWENGFKAHQCIHFF